MNKKNKAFTLTETILAFTLIGALAAFLVPILAKSQKVDEGKMSGITTSFYQGVENATLLLGTHKTLGDSNNMRTYYTNRLSGNNLPDCDPNLKAINEKIGENCSEMNGGVIAGFYYNGNCNISTKVKETFNSDDAIDIKKVVDEARGSKEDPAEAQTAAQTAALAQGRSVSGACGVIVYATEESLKDAVKNGPLLGLNVFTIGIGDSRLK